MSRKIRISGVGCCLVDKLYTKVDFNGAILKPYLSKENGDGGLVSGQLVFSEEFENFVGKDLEHILNEIVDGKAPDKINVGGPAIVALINVAQILNKKDFEVKLYEVIVQKSDEIDRGYFEKHYYFPITLNRISNNPNLAPENHGY
ncbi:MAG: hypothetical protein KAU83_01995 [Bacteroidales bacterium]|nr:hypothetical protein [Bacteroidales bacterium]